MGELAAQHMEILWALNSNSNTIYGIDIEGF